ncbi:MAG: hypothetical protein U0893_13825 [Chloroflexota bacterium]
MLMGKFAVDSLPFAFDLDLDADLKIVQVHRLTVYKTPPPI